MSFPQIPFSIIRNRKLAVSLGGATAGRSSVAAESFPLPDGILIGSASAGRSAAMIDGGRFARIRCGVLPISAIYSSVSGLVYIANLGYGGVTGEGITLIDQSTLRRTGAINSLFYPFGFSEDPTSGYLYVCDDLATNGYLYVIDPSSDSVVTNVLVGDAPLNSFFYSGDYPSTILVSNFSSNDVSVIDASTYLEITRISSIGQPYMAAFCPIDGFVYLASRADGCVYLIDPSSWTVSTSISLDGGCIGVAYVSAASRVYVTNTNTGTVSVVDPNYESVESTISVGGRPREIILSPYDGYLYVSNRSLPYLSVIDPSSDTVIGTVKIGATSSGLGYSSPTNSIFATSTEIGSVFVIPPGSFI